MIYEIEIQEMMCELKHKFEVVEMDDAVNDSA